MLTGGTRRAAVVYIILALRRSGVPSRASSEPRRGEPPGDSPNERGCFNCARFPFGRGPSPLRPPTSMSWELPDGRVEPAALSSYCVGSRDPPN